MKKITTILFIFQIVFISAAYAVDDGAGNEIIADKNLRMTNTGSPKQLQIQGSSTGFSTFQAGTNAGDINYTLPSVAPTVNQTLSAGAVSATTLIWTTPSASSVTLQSAYDNDAGTPADITLTAADGGITITQSNGALGVVPLTITNAGVGDALNVTHSSATAGNVFDFSADGTLGGTDDMVMDRTGNVGIGDITPSSKLEIGDGTDSIQFSSVGDITFVDADGAASITGPAGGALTIDSTATTGTGMAVTTNSISSGNGVSITSDSTAAASNTQTLLNVALSGANGTTTQTTYGAQISNAHTGTASTNIGLQVSTSGGATNNIALKAISGSIASTAETLAEFTVSDDATGKLLIDSASATDTAFIPTLHGIGSASRGALVLRGDITTDSGTGPAMQFNVLTTPLTAIATRPLFDFRNNFVSQMIIAASGNVGIGDTTPEVRLDVEASGATVAEFNRLTSDGTIVSLQQASVEEGTISVSGTTVSYNAFTGSHYAWTEDSQTLERGMLVTLTGNNKYLHDNPESEIIYGIITSSIPNDAKILGSYLSIQESQKSEGPENPHLVMAVGNGIMWVVDNGQNLTPGDLLVSSEVRGHAMKNPGTFSTAHVIARAAESVDWSRVTETTGSGESMRKHKLISVLFESYVLNNQDRQIQELRQDIQALKKQLQTPDKI